MQTIENYWSTSSDSEGTRVGVLSTSGVGGYKLTTATVHHAGPGDTLVLGSANDWAFWRQAPHTNYDTLTGAPAYQTFI